jgi:HD-like signal output (HDOD) protein
MESGRGAALPELLKLIETLSLNLAEVTVPELAELIEKDTVVLTRVIVVANTLANNPGISPMATLSQAIHQIGYNRIRTIAVSLMLLETAGGSNSTEQREAAATALGAGLVAQGLAEALGTHDPELVFACAALRNLGRIMMAAVSPEHFREAFARSRFVSDTEAHRPLFGLTPVELSRRLLSSGRLPESVVAALRECEPESLSGISTTYDARLLGIADYGGRLAGLVLDAREGPDAFKRKSTALAKRFERLVPGGAEAAKPALLHADRRLRSFTRGNGRTLPTLSLGRFRVRVSDLLPAGTRPVGDEIEYRPPPYTVASAGGESPSSSATVNALLSEPAAAPASDAMADPTPASGLAPAAEAVAPETLPPAAEPSAPMPAAPWDRDLVAADIFNARPADAPPVDSWLAALSAARTTTQATECWVFLPADDDAATFALAHRTLADGRLAPRAAAPLQAADRTIFGVCLSRHEIVVIHDTRDRAIAPYLPPWWHAIKSAPGAFALVPVRDGTVVRALLLVGWPTARRVSLSTAQAAILDQLARSALAQAAAV